MPLALRQPDTVLPLSLADCYQGPLEHFTPPLIEGAVPQGGYQGVSLAQCCAARRGHGALRQPLPEWRQARHRLALVEMALQHPHRSHADRSSAAESRPTRRAG